MTAYPALAGTEIERLSHRTGPSRVAIGTRLGRRDRPAQADGQHCDLKTGTGAGRARFPLLSGHFQSCIPGATMAPLDRFSPVPSPASTHSGGVWPYSLLACPFALLRCRNVAVKKIVLLACLTTFAAVLGAPAHAIPRTFVSSTGSGSTCTRAAPCATFQAAHTATDTGGEINCIDAGNFGGLSITKSITIDCTGTLATANTLISISVPGSVVRLRNLTIDGVPGTAGISFENGTALFVENCTIANFTNGIIVAPPDGVTLRLFVTNTVTNGNSANGIGLVTAGTGSVRATMDRVRSEKNPNFGLSATGAAGTGPIIMHVRNSVLTGNGIGLNAFTADGHSVLSLTADRSGTTLNMIGVASQGGPAVVVLGRSAVISNDQGLADFGGHFFSYQNNHLFGNVSDGAATAVLNLK